MIFLVNNAMVVFFVVATVNGFAETAKSSPLQLRLAIMEQQTVMLPGLQDLPDPAELIIVVFGGADPLDVVTASPTSTSNVTTRVT